MNFNKNKITLQGKRWKALLFAFFMVFSFHFFVFKANASDDCYCRSNTPSGYREDTGSPYSVGTAAQNTSNALVPLCKAKCASVNQTIYCLSFLTCGNGRTLGDACVDGTNACNAGVDVALVKNTVAPVAKAIVDPVASEFEAVIKGFLFGLLQFLSMIFGMTGTLFEWLLNPANISGPTGLLNKSAVKDVWIMVRDTLNMVFILILLFAAFCTVFQVEKWNLKKVWISILINALLVNFSFPIARFFIDVSNVAMYYFLNNMFTGTGQGSGSSIMASFGETSKLSSLLTPDNYQGAEIPYLLAAIVFTFILGVTLFVLAALFVVRLIALVLIIMFSPIGFVGNIFPAMNKFAGDWWSNLFKYAFFGPVMVFMIVVSLRIMQAMPNDTWFAAAQANSPADQANWIANSAYYTIPIIILWMAMGIAQKMGIAGADKIVGAGQKFGKWGMMKMSGGAFARDTFKAYQARRKQGDAEKMSNRFGKFLGSKQDQGGSVFGGRGGRIANQRYQADEAAEAAAAAKLHDTANMDEGQLRDLANTGDRFEHAAALLEIAARGRTNGTTELDQIRKEFGADSQVFKQAQSKVKSYDPVAAYAHLDETERNSRLKEQVTSNQFDAKKLKANSLGNADFMEIAMNEGSISPTELNELAKKGDAYSTNIKKSLTNVVNRSKKDINGKTVFAHSNVKDNENDRNMNLAYSAATGEIHESLDEAQRAEIIKRLDKDSAKNLKESEISGGESGTGFVRNLNSGKFKEIFVNMKKEESQKALISAVMKAKENNPKDEKIQLKANQLIGQMKKDPDMRIMFESLGGKFEEKSKKDKNDKKSGKESESVSLAPKIEIVSAGHRITK
jgi:hypothetical protein